MNADIKKELNHALELKNRGDYKDALAIYERHFKANPEAFKYGHREDYAWTVYKVYVQNFKSEDDLFRYAEYITRLVPQKDLNINSSCVYTSAVFKVLEKLNGEKDFYSMLSWLDMINPQLLDEKPYRRYGRIKKSKKELYFDLASKAYFKTGDFEACAEVSELALDTFSKFIDDGDVWLCWRLGNSLKELGRLEEALPYLLEAINVKNEWYMYRDVAEVYWMMNKPLDALKYCCPVVLSNVDNTIKINIYHLIYNILKGFNPEQALKHAQFFYLLKQKSGYGVPYDIEQLGIDESELDIDQLKSEIRDIWTLYKFKDQNLQHGTIIKFFEDKNYGFIRPEKGKTLFFHRNEFKGDAIHIGQEVSFYTEKRFDKTKNRESLNAVNIKADIVE